MADDKKAPSEAATKKKAEEDAAAKASANDVAKTGATKKKAEEDENKSEGPTPTQAELDAKRERRHGRHVLPGAAGAYETR